MLTTRETLESQAEKLGIPIFDTLRPNDENDGLYVRHKGGAAYILMKSCLPDSKYVTVLAEEIGHHFATTGIVVAQGSVPDIKNENLGQAWAINLLAPVCKFAYAHVLSGCTTPAQFATEWGLNDDFIIAAINYHKRKDTWPASLWELFRSISKPDYTETLRRHHIEAMIPTQKPKLYVR